MAYVKHTAIHTTPKSHLKYILNPEKNEKMKYVTGICCGDGLETAYDNFKELFEKYNNEEFEKCSSSKTAESVISAFTHILNHLTAPFLPKKHIV